MEQLPPELVEHPETVAEMKIGDIAYASVGARSVDATGGCWIWLNAHISRDHLDEDHIQSGGSRTGTISASRGARIRLKSQYAS